MNEVDFPYQFAESGRTATTGRDDYIRDLIEQVLFTAPGERVMRPDFGSGVLALVFEPNSVTLAATTQMLIQSALQQYLADLIAVQAVEVTSSEGVLHVEVRYIVLLDRTTQRELRRAGQCRMSVFHCCEPRRLELLEHSGSANAIEFLEVLDKAAPPGAPRQQTLFVRLLHNGFTLTPDNIRITGGERIRSIGVVWCAAATRCRWKLNPSSLTPWMSCRVRW
jgi:phage baseplate assembly protein W